MKQKNTRIALATTSGRRAKTTANIKPSRWYKLKASMKSRRNLCNVKTSQSKKKLTALLNLKTKQNGADQRSNLLLMTTGSATVESPNQRNIPTILRRCPAKYSSATTRNTNIATNKSFSQKQKLTDTSKVNSGDNYKNENLRLDSEEKWRRSTRRQKKIKADCKIKGKFTTVNKSICQLDSDNQDCELQNSGMSHGRRTNSQYKSIEVLSNDLSTKSTKIRSIKVPSKNKITNIHGAVVLEKSLRQQKKRKVCGNAPNGYATSGCIIQPTQMDQNTTVCCSTSNNNKAEAKNMLPNTSTTSHNANTIEKEICLACKKGRVRRSPRQQNALQGCSANHSTVKNSSDKHANNNTTERLGSTTIKYGKTSDSKQHQSHVLAGSCNSDDNDMVDATKRKGRMIGSRWQSKRPGLAVLAVTGAPVREESTETNIENLNVPLNNVLSGDGTKTSTQEKSAAKLEAATGEIARVQNTRNTSIKSANQNMLVEKKNSKIACSDQSPSSTNLAPPEGIIELIKDQMRQLELDCKSNTALSDFLLYSCKELKKEEHLARASSVASEQCYSTQIGTPTLRSIAAVASPSSESEFSLSLYKGSDEVPNSLKTLDLEGDNKLLVHDPEENPKFCLATKALSPADYVEKNIVPTYTKLSDIYTNNSKMEGSQSILQTASEVAFKNAEMDKFLTTKQLSATSEVKQGETVAILESNDPEKHNFRKEMVTSIEKKLSQVDTPTTGEQTDFAKDTGSYASLASTCEGDTHCTQALSNDWSHGCDCLSSADRMTKGTKQLEVEEKCSTNSLAKALPSQQTGNYLQSCVVENKHSEAEAKTAYNAHPVSLTDNEPRSALCLKSFRGIVLKSQSPLPPKQFSGIVLKSQHTSTNHGEMPKHQLHEINGENLGEPPCNHSLTAKKVAYDGKSGEERPTEYHCLQKQIPERNLKRRTCTQQIVPKAAKKSYFEMNTTLLSKSGFGVYCHGYSIMNPAKWNSRMLSRRELQNLKHEATSFDLKQLAHFQLHGIYFNRNRPSWTVDCLDQNKNRRIQNFFLPDLGWNTISIVLAVAKEFREMLQCKSPLKDRLPGTREKAAPRLQINQQLKELPAKKAATKKLTLLEQISSSNSCNGILNKDVTETSELKDVSFVDSLYFPSSSKRLKLNNGKPLNKDSDMYRKIFDPFGVDFIPGCDCLPLCSKSCDLMDIITLDDIVTTDYCSLFDSFCDM